MTYEELMQFLSGAQTMPWTREDYNAGAFNPNSQSGAWTGTADPMWSGLQGAESFYQPGQGYEGTPSLDRDAMWQYLQDNGMSWNVGQKGDETVNYIQGPDGKPIADTANWTRAEDDRFKLAALAAMGVTGANIGLANGMFGGTGGMTSAQASAMNPEMYGLATQTGLGEGAAMGSGVASGFGNPEAFNLVEQLGAGSGASGLAGAAKTAGGLLSTVGDIAKVALPIAGAIGGAKGSEGETTTQKRTMDPRMEAYVYDSYLPSLKETWEKGKTPNANQQKGWDMQLGLLTDPARMKQLQDMQTAAFNRFNSPVAGNPFTSGAAQLYQPRRGLLGGG